jgi:hypothetical protein
MEFSETTGQYLCELASRDRKTAPSRLAPIPSHMANEFFEPRRARGAFETEEVFQRMKKKERWDLGR